MTEDSPTLQPEHSPAKPWYRHELLLFIGGSVVIAFLLVLVSMALYTSSGAAQLDLSRPGYKAVVSKVDSNDSFQGFSASGPIDKSTLDNFLDLYHKQVTPVGSDAFSTAPLDDKSLGIDDPSTGQ